jgi:transcriptional regulator with XRE-family HTH domain
MYSMADKMSVYSFGEWLAEMLKKHEINQSELARKAGVTRGAINGVLSGARGPGPELCTAIARAFGIQPEEVFRQAGFLPPKSEADEIIEMADWIMGSFKYTKTKRRALAILETLRVEEEKEENGEYDAKLADYPAPSETG